MLWQFPKSVHTTHKKMERISNLLTNEAYWNDKCLQFLCSFGKVVWLTIARKFVTETARLFKKILLSNKYTTTRKRKKRRALFSCRRSSFQWCKKRTTRIKPKRKGGPFCLLSVPTRKKKVDSPKTATNPQLVTFCYTDNKDCFLPMSAFPVPFWWVLLQ